MNQLRIEIPSLGVRDKCIASPLALQRAFQLSRHVQSVGSTRVHRLLARIVPSLSPVKQASIQRKLLSSQYR